MYIPDRVAENLRFLIREVQLQIGRTRVFVRERSEATEDSLRGRDNYIDNLRTFIQRASFERAGKADNLAVPMAATTIATNLERIADFCIDIIDQLRHLDEDDWPAVEELEPFLAEVERGLSHVERAVLERDVHEALEICHAEPRLDELYSEAFQKRLASMEQGERVHASITMLFIEHYFERMGDSLMNIGEAVISAALGEKVKIGQLWALQDSLQDVDPLRAVTDVHLRVPGESRSGCRIATVSDPASARAALVFKEGSLDKLRDEQQAIALWEQLVPGISPAVRSFHENGDRAAMLMEFLGGETLEQVLLQGTAAQLATAVEQTGRTLRHVWRETFQREAAPPSFVKQLRRRLTDVLAIHPHFERRSTALGNKRIPSLAELLDALAEVEGRVGFAGSTLIHGDFNLDNIIPDPEGEYVRLIDLHRSMRGDYLQDMSVLLVSCFRLQVFERPVRARIRSVTGAVLELARAQAAEWGDTAMEARLALGLVRSFVTSTRFILDEGFARGMFLRGMYLADRLVAAPDLERFRIPADVFRD
ncbi:MAG: phosphotransferase [Planctomycetes bacterium]|nr:phosphotransferase [Planctomycetota bacterium]